MVRGDRFSRKAIRHAVGSYCHERLAGKPSPWVVHLEGFLFSSLYQVLVCRSCVCVCGWLGKNVLVGPDMTYMDGERHPQTP
jgi:hypothetical protein